MTPKQLRMVGTGIAVGLIVIACILPFVLQAYWVDVITDWIPLAVAALGLNLLTGYNGQISVGHGAIYGVGAYTAAVLVQKLELPFLVAIAGAGVMCFFVGVLIGLPALRIKGLYLALVTLAVATLFPDVIKSLEGWFGGGPNYKITSMQLHRGSMKPRIIQWQAPSWLPLADDQWLYLVFLAIAVLCFVGVRNLMRSRMGRAIVAVRDNEIAATTNGVNVSAVKVLTFGVSSALAGMAGALFALKAGQLSPNTFVLTISLYFLVAVVVGGPASVLGPAIGAVVYGAFDRLITPELPEKVQPATPLILAILLVTLMLVAPGGIVGLARSFGAKLISRNARTPEMATSGEPT